MLADMMSGLFGGGKTGGFFANMGNSDAVPMRFGFDGIDPGLRPPQLNMMPISQPDAPTAQAPTTSPAPMPRPMPRPNVVANDSNPMTWREVLQATGGQPETGDPVRDGTYAALNSPQGLIDASARGPVPQSSAEAARRAALLALLPNTFGGM